MKSLALLLLAACASGGPLMKNAAPTPDSPRLVLGPDAPAGPVWVAGFAQNAKLGAVVEAHALVVRCEALDAWPATRVGKPVLVAGTLATVSHPALPVGPAGERSAGAEGDEHVLRGCSPINEGDDAELIAIEQAIFAALAKRDRAALSDIVAVDFVLRMPAQPDIGRDAFLDAAAAIPGEILEVRGEGVTARRAGDVGVVQGQQIARVRVDDEVHVDRGFFVDILVRRGGRWVMTFALNTPANP